MFFEVVIRGLREHTVKKLTFGVSVFQHRKWFNLLCLDVVYYVSFWNSDLEHLHWILF